MYKSISFEWQKMMFYIAKDGLLQPKTHSFAE